MVISPMRVVGGDGWVAAVAAVYWTPASSLAEGRHAPSYLIRRFYQTWEAMHTLPSLIEKKAKGQRY